MAELVPPVLSNERVAQIVQSHYTVAPIDPACIKLLHGYKDRNYYIRESCTNTDSSSSGKEYVFKVMNQKDSKFPDFFDALSKLMFFINAEGFNCSLPLQPVDVPEGKFIVPLKQSYMLETKLKKDVTYVGFLLTYVPGVPMGEVECSPKFLYSIGEFVGKLSTSLQKFFHPYFEARYLCFDLKHFLDNKSILKKMTVAEDKQMFESVFKLFSEHVIPKMSCFKVGAVHNDLNYDNILCVKRSDGDPLKLSGVIDVMDTIISHSVFDGAVCIAYMMMMKDCINPLEFSKPLVSGYLNNYSLNNEEFNCLYYLVAAHLAQSFLHALHSQTVDPDNLYRTRFQQKSYTALKFLLSTPKQEVDKMWKQAQLKTF